MAIKPFDLNLLRVIVALDQTRHVGRAAELLDMSQSGFSSALMRLRHRLGDDLFVRTKSGMQPTQRAQALVDVARTAMVQVEQSVLGTEHFEPLHSERVFHLSMSDVAEVIYIPRLVQTLSRLAPATSIQVSSPGLAPLHERLASGEVEIAIGYLPGLEHDAYFRQPLFSNTYACIVRRGHPILKTGMDRAAFQSLGHAVVSTPARSNALLESTIERLRIKRRIAVSSPNHLSLPATIASTDLVATLPLGAAVDLSRTGEIVVLPLPFRPPSFTMYQYWHRRTHKEPALQWLRAQIKAQVNRDTDPYASERKALYGLMK